MIKGSAQKVIASCIQPSFAHLKSFESAAFQLHWVQARVLFQLFASWGSQKARKGWDYTVDQHLLWAALVAPTLSDEKVEIQGTRIRENPLNFPMFDLWIWMRFWDGNGLSHSVSSWVFTADCGSHTEYRLIPYIHIIWADCHQHAAWLNSKFHLLLWWSGIQRSCYQFMNVIFSCWPSELLRTKPAVMLAGPAMMEGGRDRHNGNSSKPIKKDDSPMI